MPFNSFLKVFIFALLMMHSSSFAYASNETAHETEQWLTLPEEIFTPLVAVVREPQFSIRKEIYSGQNGNFNAGSVSFGDYLPMFGYRYQDNSEIQFQIDGALFATYNLDTQSMDLFNTDYIFGLSLAYADGPLSTRLRLYHESSHLGDEFLIANPEVERSNSSFEESQLTVAYQFEKVRVYGGGGAIFRSQSLDNLDPLSVRTGAEFRHHLNYSIDFLTAVDLNIAQRSEWKLSRSFLLGLVILQNETKEVRIMGSYYGGSSPQGQFFKDRVEYVGLGIYFII